MIIFGPQIADAPFNRGSSNIGVSMEIRGRFLANADLLERFKKTKSRRDIFKIKVYILTFSSRMYRIFCQVVSSGKDKERR